MPEDRAFVDTNIIIYAYDLSAGRKHDMAKEIIADLWSSRRGLLSTQVVQEFFESATKKISKPLSIKLAKEIARDLLEWNIIINNGKSILDAIEIHSRYKYSFWDSMIIQAAISGGAAILLSEDLTDGQVISGVRIRNPFTTSSA